VGNSARSISLACGLAGILAACQPATPPAKIALPPAWTPTPLVSTTSVSDLGATATPPAWYSTLEARWTQEVISASFSPTPRPTSTPDDRPLSSRGPWLVFYSSDRLWATDGDVVSLLDSSLSDPADEIMERPIPFSTAGGLIAYTSRSPLSREGSPQYDLRILDLTGGTTHPPLHLVSSELIATLPERYPGDLSEPWTEAWFQAEQVRAAVSRDASLAWSPDGSTLAFVSALDAPNTDLYTLTLRTNSVRRLTSGPFQTADVRWSPSGTAVLHTATSDINVGRDGPRLIIEGVWSALPSSGGIAKVTQGQVEFLQWLSGERAAFYNVEVPCPNYALRGINLHSGSATALWQGPFDAAAIDPITGTLLVTVPFFEPDTAATVSQHCPPDALPAVPEGLYISKPGLPSPIRLAGSGGPVVWSPEARQFFADTPDGVFQISPEAPLQPIPVDSREIPVPSPRNDLWFVVRPSGNGAIITPSGDPVASFAAEPCRALWSPDGDTVVFTDGEALYIADGPEFEPTELFHADQHDLCWAQAEWVGK